MHQIRDADFPGTFVIPFIKTSDATTRYNCIGWACGDNTRWYWPVNRYFWPAGIRREVIVEAFIQLFESLGYTVCDNPDLETGVLKVAIFCDSAGKPTHAARQLIDGLWTSKLGSAIDVSHNLQAMNNGTYGNATVYLKRPLKLALSK